MSWLSGEKPMRHNAATEKSPLKGRWVENQEDCFATAQGRLLAKFAHRANY